MFTTATTETLSKAKAEFQNGSVKQNQWCAQEGTRSSNVLRTTAEGRTYARWRSLGIRRRSRNKHRSRPILASAHILDRSPVRWARRWVKKGARPTEKGARPAEKSARLATTGRGWMKRAWGKESIVVEQLAAGTIFSTHVSLTSIVCPLMYLPWMAYGIHHNCIIMFLWTWRSPFLMDESFSWDPIAMDANQSKSNTSVMGEHRCVIKLLASSLENFRSTKTICFFSFVYTSFVYTERASSPV